MSSPSRGAHGGFRSLLKNNPPFSRQDPPIFFPQDTAMDETLTNHNPTPVVLSPEVEVTIVGDIPMATPVTPVTIGVFNHQNLNLNSPTHLANHFFAHSTSSQAPTNAHHHHPGFHIPPLLPIPIVEFQTREVEPQVRFWTPSLVAHYVGHHNPEDDIQERLEALWGTGVRVRHLAADVLLINILDDNEADRILGGSPWELPSSYLFLQLWDAGITPSTLEINQVPTWIEVKELPLEFWPVHHLTRVLKPLGTLVCIEQEGLFYSDLRWLRAMIMVDLSKPRHSHLHVHCGGKVATISIAYQGNHRICIRCGGIGHSHEGCGGPPGSGKDWSRNFLVPETHNNDDFNNESQGNEEGANSQQQQNNNNGNDTNHVTNSTTNDEDYNTPPNSQQSSVNVVAPVEQQFEGPPVDYAALQAAIQQYEGPYIKVETPSDYGSASASSLDNDYGGAWRMTVPDFDFNFSLDDMQQDDSLCLTDPHFWPAAEMVIDDTNPKNGATNVLNDLAMVEWAPPLPGDVSAQGGVHPNPMNMGPTCALLSNGYGPNSGLLDMIVDPIGVYARSAVGAAAAKVDALMMTATDGIPATDTCAPTRPKRSRDHAIKTAQATLDDPGVEQKSLELLHSKLLEVVEKVERAVTALPASSKTKKIKQTITMTAAEVRDFTKLLEERSTIEGVLLKEEDAVVILSSDSSEGSEGRGTKRKSRGTKEWERKTAVSSRLRSKARPKLQLAAEIVKRAQRKKLKRIPVCKIKAGGNKVNTKLTLAPPSPGTVE